MLLAQALEGGGAKNINFQELASDLAQITFDYPFRIPPYFALIIRAIGVLEGIALVGDPEFAIVDESYPYIAKRLLTDSSQTSQKALRYMIYGQGNVFDVDRLIDILEAFEEFTSAISTARGTTARKISWIYLRECILAQWNAGRWSLPLFTQRELTLSFLSLLLLLLLLLLLREEQATLIKPHLKSRATDLPRP